MCSAWFCKFIRRNCHQPANYECRHVVGGDGACGLHGYAHSGEYVLDVEQLQLIAVTGQVS